ncbi:MAG: LysR family transcriptional regulator [Anaerostipes sp.]|jgi:DNA-binding transcriptional LysR family regulator|nr:LysR family transcriptional regulator [Anaerostipes sp.]
MELRNLITFTKVAELHSFSKAAVELGYSQSAVSTQIAGLEKELKKRLFDRIGRTVYLTQEGERLLEYSQKMIRLEHQAKKAMEQAPKESGLLRIAMAESLCNSYFPEILQEYTSEYPQVEVVIKTGVTTEMFQMLHQNEVDMIFTLDQRIYQSDLVIAQEKESPMTFIAPKNHPLTKKKKVLLKELMKYPMIATEQGMSYGARLDEELALQSLEMKPQIELGNTHMILDLVARGVGCAFLPEFVVTQGIKMGEVSKLNISDCYIQIWTQLIYHKDKWLSPAMEAMIKKIREHC